MYAASLIDKGFASELRMAVKILSGKGEDRDPAEKRGNPCSSRLTESCLTYMCDEQHT